MDIKLDFCNMDSFSILGCPCFRFGTEDEAKRLLVSLVESGRGGYSVAINAEKISRYRTDPALRSVINDAAMPVPDGSGAVLGLRLLHGVSTVKLDLPKIVLECADARGWRLFVGGSLEDVNREAFMVIRTKYPGIVLCGRANGFLEEATFIRTVNSCAPQVILLALGSPKQEYTASRMVPVLPGTFIVGCGGALDALTGRVPRAPALMVNNHLEWLFRLYKNPSRWRRQLQLPRYFARLIFEATRLKMRGILS